MFETIRAGIPELGVGGGGCFPLRFCTEEGTEIEDLVNVDLVSKIATNLSFQSYIEFTEELGNTKFRLERGWALNISYRTFRHKSGRSVNHQYQL